MCVIAADGKEFTLYKVNIVYENLLFNGAKKYKQFTIIYWFYIIHLLKNCLYETAKCDNTVSGWHNCKTLLKY